MNKNITTMSFVAALMAATSLPAWADISKGVDAHRLIGHEVINGQNENIGKVKSVEMTKDGNIDTVVVGVGGFLGIGDHYVAISGKNLTWTQNGDKLTADVTKDLLKGMPEYKARSGVTVISDASPARPAPAANTAARPAPAAAPARTTAANDTKKAGKVAFNAKGEMSGQALIGAKLTNPAHENVGEIKEIYIGNDGQINNVVASVGGFLGVGNRDVSLAWKDLKVTRDKDDLVVMTSASKDQLKSLPEYRSGVR